MWIQFYLIALVMSLIIFVPGFFLLQAAGLSWSMAICCGPLIGFAAFSVSSQALSLLGVSVGPWVLVPITVISLLLFAFSKARHWKSFDSSKVAIPAMVLIVLIGQVLGKMLFTSRLGSPDALFQSYDITQHLNIIQAMTDSGRLSSLGVSPYMSAADAAISPVDYSGFYPSGWHSLCAITILVTGTNVTTAINASMLVLTCIVFPLGMLGFISTILPSNTRYQVIGALVSLAFEVFPWGLLTFGPIYANVAGYCLLPGAMALFTSLLSRTNSPRKQIPIWLLLFLGVIGLALCHPNTIFTCIVILAPYCVHMIEAYCKEKGISRGISIIARVSFVFVVVAFWVFCFKLPAFSETVSHVWKPFAWLWQALVNVVTVSYCNGFDLEITAQFLLGILIAIGFISALYDRDRRWLSASYAITCYILIISITHNDEYKQLLAGFWYTDPMRLATNCVIAGIPLAILGADWIRGSVVQVVNKYNNSRSRTSHLALVNSILAALFLVINFMPEFNLAGQHYTYTAAETQANKNKDYRDWTKTFHTTFGDYRSLASTVYSYNAPLDSTEKAFLNKVQSFIEPDSLIVNNPMDGSFLAYGLDDIRVYYRNFVGMDSGTETNESKLIRLHLNEIASNDQVREAVKTVKAKYVMVLRESENEASFIDLRGDYKPELFSGITSIDESTPGFTCLYKIGPMALYQID